MKRIVWRDYDKESCVYVPRCSHCGRFKKNLKQHWFFTGLYCIACIQDVLYDNARRLSEIQK